MEFRKKKEIACPVCRSAIKLGLSFEVSIHHIEIEAERKKTSPSIYEVEHITTAYQPGLPRTSCFDEFFLISTKDKTVAGFTDGYVLLFQDELPECFDRRENDRGATLSDQLVATPVMAGECKPWNTLGGFFVQFINLPEGKLIEGVALLRAVVDLAFWLCSEARFFYSESRFYMTHPDGKLFMVSQARNIRE